MNYLAVDIGNSGLRVAELHLADQRVGPATRVYWTYPLQTQPAKQPRGEKRYVPNGTDWLQEIEPFLESTTECHWLISSVRRDARQILQRALEARQGHTCQMIRHSDLPIEVNVEYPDRVGIDRLLAATAATQIVKREIVESNSTEATPQHHRHIVIQAGSAITVDLVDFLHGQATFQGGAIVPGVPMMLRLLGSGTDLLPQVDAEELNSLPPLPGRNTEQAMLCGAASALLGGVKHLIERYREEFPVHSTPSLDSDVSSGLAPMTTIISGGDGPSLAKHLPAPVRVEKDLVLQGLLHLAKSGPDQIAKLA
jgi:type III pantothenate kinase